LELLPLSASPGRDAKLRTLWRETVTIPTNRANSISKGCPAP
jgi:hypothetical protein